MSVCYVYFSEFLWALRIQQIWLQKKIEIAFSDHLILINAMTIEMPTYCYSSLIIILYDIVLYYVVFGVTNNIVF